MLLAEGEESWLHQNIDLIGLIALVVGVMAIIVAVVIYQKQKAPKTLDYAIESTREVASGNEFDGSRLKVIWVSDSNIDPSKTLSGRNLDQPRITNVYIRNTGKQEIESEDFKDPINLLVKGGEIIDVSVTEVSHGGIHKRGSLSSNGFTKVKWSLRPALLNRRDWIRLQVITNRAKSMELNSWMKGETRPMKLRQGLLDPPLKDVLLRRVKLIPASEVAAGGGIVFAVVA